MNKAECDDTRMTVATPDEAPTARRALATRFSSSLFHATLPLFFGEPDFDALGMLSPVRSSAFAAHTRRDSEEIAITAGSLRTIRCGIIRWPGICRRHLALALTPRHSGFPDQRRCFGGNYRRERFRDNGGSGLRVRRYYSAQCRIG